MTWANLMVRSFGLLALLPMVMAASTPAELVVWLLLANSAAYVMIADFGLLPTCTRAVAYSTASLGQQPAGSAEGEFIAKAGGMPAVVGAMRSMYRQAAGLTLVLMPIIGGAALVDPVSAITHQQIAWLAAVSVLVGSCVAVYGNRYVAVLNGIGDVALTQGILALTGAAGLVSGFIVLAANSGTFVVIIVQQFWGIVGVWQCRRAAAARLHRMGIAGRFEPDRALRSWVWSGAWKSGVATLLSAGSLQASNLLVAQVPDRVASAAYLFSMRLIQAVNQFSQAPFYSRIPVLARLHAEGKPLHKYQLAASSMRAAYWVYVCGFIAVGAAAGPLLLAVGSPVSISEPVVWSMLGLAFLGERYGAMHLQLYSTTNHIVWHVAAALLFAGFLLIGVPLYRVLGLPAVPAALLVSYWLLYASYCARHSYREMGMPLFRFERTVLLPPLAAILLFIAARLLVQNE